MDPQLAAGGGMPRPRKLSVASASTAPAMPMAPCTIIGCTILGRMWRTKHAHIAGSERARRLDEFALANCQDLRTHQSRIADPAADGEREH